MEKQSQAFDHEAINEQLIRIRDFESKWIEKSMTATQYQFAAHHIVKMIQSKYDTYQIIEVLANMCDEVFEKLHKTHDAMPPKPIYIDPNNYTVEQLQKIIDFKNKEVKS